MKTTISNGLPCANLCINKSRLKIYNKDSKVPTYYLKKGSEFAIELFNPTTNTILAKIHLNGSSITQGGLILRPGERVFLERYIDVAKKFLFDTYEVANTNEVKKAIEENGDFKVEFYNEYIPVYSNPILTIIPSYHQGYYNGQGIGICGSSRSHTGLSGTITTSNAIGASTTIGTTSNYSTNTLAVGNVTNTNSFTGQDSLGFGQIDNETQSLRSLKKSSLFSKKLIETGRVEAGSISNQELKTVNKNFLSYPFHTIEYKMLPLSQKINTLDDVNIRRYCGSCGVKSSPNNKFCPSCGSKQ